MKTDDDHTTTTTIIFKNKLNSLKTLSFRLRKMENGMEKVKVSFKKEDTLSRL